MSISKLIFVFYYVLMVILILFNLFFLSPVAMAEYAWARSQAVFYVSIYLSVAGMIGVILKRAVVPLIRRWVKKLSYRIQVKQLTVEKHGEMGVYQSFSIQTPSFTIIITKTWNGITFLYPLSILIRINGTCVIRLFFWVTWKKL